MVSSTVGNAMGGSKSCWKRRTGRSRRVRHPKSKKCVVLCSNIDPNNPTPVPVAQKLTYGTPPQTLSEVRAAFAGSLAALWLVLAATSGARFLVSLFMRSLPLSNTLDQDWVLKNEKVDPSV
ncbi:hypothetical protein L210DRAFT_2323324 [Boletus edulis BED1]|uniref:Uncharacterized protein n=1 Tax=Boletus edulis BED1 TaxID=1328754 RepID=A0AAD4BD52_BOLED|nr:hypothetical protein L210DRAFT_2323324 [Boletus edulis BED1]